DLAAQSHDDRIDAGPYAARDIATAKPWDDDVVDDPIGGGIGHFAFEAVADLDPQFMIFRCHDQEDAVVLALLADPPTAAERQAPILDGVTAQIGQGHDHKLDARGCLEARQLALDLVAGPVVQDVGRIDEAAG